LRARQKAGAIRHNGISGRIVVLGQIFPLGRIVKIVLLIIRESIVRVCFFVIVIVIVIVSRGTVDVVWDAVGQARQGFFAGGGGGRGVVIIIVAFRDTVELVCFKEDSLSGFFAGGGGGRGVVIIIVVLVVVALL